MDADVDIEKEDLPITEMLVKHSLDMSFKKLPDEVIEKCKILFLDFLGIPLKASENESSKVLMDSISSIVCSWSADMQGLSALNTATSIPYGYKFPPQYAALINGTLAHSLDFDDTHREASIHPGAAIIPVILALGELNEIDGKKFIEAMVAGYDVACKLGMAVNPAEHYAHGFHGTATCGLFGATVAGGVVSELDELGLLNALGLNISMAAGSMQFLENGAWNKRLHPGLAAHNAILSIVLARNGFTGAEKPLEGKNGFLKSYSHKSDPEKAVLDLGERYEVMYTGIKPYPCCRYIHPAIDLILKHSIEGEIIEIDVEMVSAGYGIVGTPPERKQNPENVVDAQFSMPFAIAVTILRKKLTVSEFTPEVIFDERVRSMMRRVSVVANKELDKEYPQKWPVILRIKTKQKEEVLRKDYPSGEPEDPLSFEQVAEKFESLVSGKLSDSRIDDTIEFVKRLENRSIRELFEIITGG
jgi:2-methylcitrate dehydratase PrpD